MKKPNKHRLKWLKEQYRREQAKRRRAAGAKKHLKLLRSAYLAANSELIQKHLLRQDTVRRVYRRRPFFGPTKAVIIDGHFGIEELSGFDYFIDKASEFIEFDNKELSIDLNRCTRAWPSSITLLASLKQWVELTAQAKAKPRISSSAPEDDAVSSYLGHSGLYEYVNRGSEQTHTLFDASNIVRIKREFKRNPADREKEIMALLKKHSLLSEEELERFDCVILSEITNNITEHGRLNKDEGWWVLAQHHPTHSFISICLADNGFGFGHSLRTGSQSLYIESQLGSDILDDGMCIRLALDENISGSLAALPPEGKWRKKFQSGARKGNGLKRLVDTCKKLGIRLTILSHRGYVVIDEQGKCVRHGSKPSNIFAGTLYHLLVRAKGKE